MLTLTENATTVVKAITEQMTDAPEAGLRFSETAQDPAGLAVEPVPAPQPDDEFVEQDGARLYLDPTASVELGDKQLDAAVDSSGQVEFSLSPQA